MKQTIVLLLIGIAGMGQLQAVDSNLGLWRALEAGDVSMIRYWVIAGGANLDVPNDLAPPTSATRGLTPLQYAVMNRDFAAVRELIILGARVRTRHPRGLLHVAAANGYEDIAELLIQAGIDIHEMIRVRLGSRQRAELPPLLIAAEAGYLALANTLLANGANALSGRTTPLERAVHYGLYHATRNLLRLGVDPNEASDSIGHPALIIAVEEDNLRILRLLLRHGANANTATRSSNITALHFAVRKGYVGIVRELLRYGANPNTQDVTEHTPLHFAARTANVAMLQHFVQQPSLQVNIRNNRGETALHLAAASGNADAVLTLLNVESGSDAETINVNATENHFTQTPLHYAVGARNAMMVAALLEAGADPDAEDRHGRTPLDIADDLGLDDIIELLEPSSDSDFSSSDSENNSTSSGGYSSEDAEIIILEIQPPNTLDPFFRGYHSA